MLFALIGIAANLIGTAMQVNAANKAADASKRAEALRERQMNLEAARQRRQVIRNALKARSLALNSATAQGAASGSGLQGGYGQIAQQTGENMVGINQGTEIGAGIFAANRQAADAQALVAFGQGLSSMGSTISSNSDNFGRMFGAK